MRIKFKKRSRFSHVKPVSVFPHICVRVEYSIYYNFSIFCKRYNLETKTYLIVAFSGTKKNGDNIQLIYLGVNGNKIWLQGVRFEKLWCKWTYA